LYGQVCNDRFLAESPIAVPDPEWWTYINDEFISSDIPVYQDCQVASESVSFETPFVNEVGTDSLSAEIQPANLPFGDNQQLLDFNPHIDLDIILGQDHQAHPNGEDSTVTQNFNSIRQPIWKYSESSSSQHSICDSTTIESNVSTPPELTTLSQESQKNVKCQILVLQSFECPHCHEIFPSERVGYVYSSHLFYEIFSNEYRSHVRNSHKHIRQPNTCADCGSEFTLPKDLNRHLQSVSCRQGKVPKRPFVCRCGKDFSRKDHLSRHINTFSTRRGHEKKHCGTGKVKQLK